MSLHPSQDLRYSFHRCWGFYSYSTTTKPVSSIPIAITSPTFQSSLTHIQMAEMAGCKREMVFVVTQPSGQYIYEWEPCQSNERIRLVKKFYFLISWVPFRKTATCRMYKLWGHAIRREKHHTVPKIPFPQIVVWPSSSYPECLFSNVTLSENSSYYLNNSGNSHFTYLCLLYFLLFQRNCNSEPKIITGTQ